jgi:hypothetical protein
VTYLRGHRAKAFSPPRAGRRVGPRVRREDRTARHGRGSLVGAHPRGGCRGCSRGRSRGGSSGSRSPRSRGPSATAGFRCGVCGGERSNRESRAVCGLAMPRRIRVRGSAGGGVGLGDAGSLGLREAHRASGFERADESAVRQRVRAIPRVDSTRRSRVPNAPLGRAAGVRYGFRLPERLHLLLAIVGPADAGCCRVGWRPRRRLVPFGRSVRHEAGVRRIVDMSGVKDALAQAPEQSARLSREASREVSREVSREADHRAK